jgi:hypothetical protein
MTYVDSTRGCASAAPPRRRGAPKGNRNAWKHGGRSAAAKLAREAARAALVARLPDARVWRPSLKFADTAHALLSGAATRVESHGVVAGEGEPPPSFLPNKTNNSVSSPKAGEGDPPPPFLPNKTNNSVAHPKAGEGDPPPPFLPNKTNNSVARESGRRRGAPKGNKNALKHGLKSGERRAFGADLRQFLHRLDAICALAHAMASTRRTR